jgi:hypothetical protein
MAFLGVLGLWAGLLIAGWWYPSEYDWRYLTISRLLSPERNPAGHLWGTGGIVLCGLCGLWWTSGLARRWVHASAETRPGGSRTMQVGFVGMACASALPQWLDRIPKGHEMLALFAWSTLLLGMMRMTFQTTERAVPRRMGASIGGPRLYATVLVGIALLPILLAGFALGYVYFVLPQLPWVNLSWRARGVPVYLSFAFWQWITLLLLSAYMGVLALVVPTVYRRSKPHRAPQAEAVQ